MASIGNSVRNRPRSILDSLPEINLLRWSARQLLTPGADLDLPPDLLAAVRWSRLLWLAQQHGVLLSLSESTRSSDSKLVPADMSRQLAALRSANQLSHLSRGRELCLLQDLFDRHRIRAVSVAGWTLAQRHYRQPALRVVGPTTAYTIDRSDRIRIGAVLADAGYDLTDDPLRLDEFHRSRVILHWPSATRSAGRDPATANNWNAAESFSYGGRTLLTPSPTDWLIHLCTLGTAHLWMQLRRACDVVALVAHNPAFDWADIFERARQWGLERAVLLGVAASHRLLDVPLPAPASARLEQFPAVARITRALALHVCRGTATTPGRLTLLRARLALQDDFPHKVRCVAAQLRAGWLRRPQPVQPQGKEVASIGRYTPTPLVVVEAMLKLAGTTACDLVYDLGCGDGRIVIAAAAGFGARGVGIDIDPQRIAQAEALAVWQRVTDRVSFIHGDVLKMDVSKASVVCLYLQGLAYPRLRRKLQRELRPGTRVVSHNFLFHGWVPEQTEIISITPARVTRIYLWRIG